MPFTKTIIGAILVTQNRYYFIQISLLTFLDLLGKTNLFFNHTVVKREQNIFFSIPDKNQEGASRLLINNDANSSVVGLQKNGTRPCRYKGPEKK